MNLEDILTLSPWAIEVLQLKKLLIIDRAGFNAMCLKIFTTCGFQYPLTTLTEAV